MVDNFIVVSRSLFEQLAAVEKDLLGMRKDYNEVLANLVLAGRVEVVVNKDDYRRWTLKQGEKLVAILDIIDELREQRAEIRYLIDEKMGLVMDDWTLD